MYMVVILGLPSHKKLSLKVHVFDFNIHDFKSLSQISKKASIFFILGHYFLVDNVKNESTVEIGYNDIHGAAHFGRFIRLVV